MGNDMIEVTDETRKKLRDFDEQEAYFLLCEIFSQAQATKNYAKFQSDLSEWKKRFDINLFSEDYRRKIKYMLSKEFLDKVLQNFTTFDEQSKMDYSKGLEELRRIFSKAEKHKDGNKLDKDLEVFFNRYSLKIFKQKYPHILSQLLSKSNRTRVLEKFDSSLAFAELTNIIENPHNYKDANDFKDAINEWQKLYPISDFNSTYKVQIEKLLSESLDERKLEEVFTFSNELDLSEGQIIPLDLKNISIVNKDALHEFFKIVDANKGDINSLFDWICKYGKYINDFNSDTKSMIVNNLMSKYYHELPPAGTNFQIPKLDSGMNDLLSLSEFNSIDDTKKQVVLQLLGILSNGMALSNEDIYRLGIINSKAEKIEVIENAQISKELDSFMQETSEDTLTPTDTIYLGLATDTHIDVSISDDIDLTLSKEENSNDIIVEEQKVHTSSTDSFKESIKVKETLEKINSNSDTTGTSDNGSSTSGGTSASISLNNSVDVDSLVENDEEDSKAKEEDIQTDFITDISSANPDIKATIIETNSDVVNDIMPEFNEPIIENNHNIKAVSEQENVVQITEDTVSEEDSIPTAIILDAIPTPDNNDKSDFSSPTATILAPVPAPDYSEETEPTVSKATILDPIPSPDNNKKTTFRERLAGVFPKRPRASGENEMDRDDGR